MVTVEAFKVITEGKKSAEMASEEQWNLVEMDERRKTHKGIQACSYEMRNL